MKFKLIQVFRGLAAMSVVIFHLGINSYDHIKYIPYHNFFNFGGIGLDFFFVLSGFIITYIHLNDLNNPTRAGFINFFKKRFIRIMPVYWFLAVLTTIIYYINTPAFMLQAGMKIDFFSAATYVYLLQSYLLIHTGNPGLIGVAWTLSYEFLFYIVFGIGIIMGFRYAKVMVSVWILLIILFFFKPALNTPYTVFYFNILILEFLMGCLTAYLIISNYVFSFKYIIPLALVLLFLMITLLKIPGLGYNYPRTFYNVMLIGSFFSVLTYISVQIDKRYNYKCPAILILIGDASYSIYLTHIMILSPFTKIVGKLTPRFIAVGYLDYVITLIFVSSIAIGIVFHILVEKRLLKFANRILFPKQASLRVT